MVRARLRYEYVVAVVFVTGLFMEILDTTIVNVALPTLGREFGVGTSSIEWVVIAYLLSLAVWIPASGWIGDKVGTKQTFFFAIGTFTVASALCGQAHSLGELSRSATCSGWKAWAGVGVAALGFPVYWLWKGRRAKASTVLIIPTVMAPALGPVVGGLLVTQLSWRWIFYVNVPLGIMAFAFGFFFLREHREPTAGPFDAAGFVLSGGGLALVLYALSEGPFKGWRSPVVLGAAVAGIVAFALLAWVELRQPHPMLAVRLFADGCSATPTWPRCSPTPASPACCSSCRSSCRTSGASRRSSPGSRPSRRPSACWSRPRSPAGCTRPSALGGSWCSGWSARRAPSRPSRRST
jgi:EmrB/QacA subfamily drug resistance transporter